MAAASRLNDTLWNSSSFFKILPVAPTDKVGSPRWSVIKMGAELFVGDKASRLSKDGSERSEIECGVSRNGKHLVARRPHTFQLHMAAPLCDDDEPKRFEDCDNVGPGQPTKLGHRWDRLQA